MSRKRAAAVVDEPYVDSDEDGNTADVPGLTLTFE